VRTADCRSSWVVVAGASDGIAADRAACPLPLVAAWLALTAVFDARAVVPVCRARRGAVAAFFVPAGAGSWLGAAIFLRLPLWFAFFDMAILLFSYSVGARTRRRSTSRDQRHVALSIATVQWSLLAAAFSALSL
jgi:hypothetical protein